MDGAYIRGCGWGLHKRLLVGAYISCGWGLRKRLWVGPTQERWGLMCHSQLVELTTPLFIDAIIDYTFTQIVSSFQRHQKNASNVSSKCMLTGFYL